MSLLLRGARILDEGRDEIADLLVEGGRIADLGPGIPASGETRVLDCSRASASGTPLALLPAFVDLHVHFRDPGFPEKETLETGCLAAAAGGFGTVFAMANTRPATDSLGLALAARERAARLCLVDYLPAIATTRGLEGRDLSHLGELEALAAEGGTPALRELGLRALSDDGRDGAEDGVLLEAMRRAARLGLLLVSHCERGPNSPPAGREASDWYASEEGAEADRQAEIRGVERALRLAREAGCPLHLCHLSTGESVELVRRAKAGLGAEAAEARGAATELGAAGFRLTCEATPHHLVLDRGAALAAGAGGAGRVNPWLRGADDREALLEGLLDGTIDAIATDHAPHTAADKAAGAPGFSGLETAFPLALEALGGGSPSSERLRLLSALMGSRPAGVLGLEDRGRLRPGLRADLVLVDLEASWKAEPAAFRSRGRNSLLGGRLLRGKVVLSIHQGRIVYEQF